MDVRSRIRELLDEKGLSVREVSLNAGLSDSMLHKFLSKQTHSITIDNLEKIARALGVSVRYLWLGEAEHEKVVYLWDRITEQNRGTALRILEGFADDRESADG